MGRRRPSWLRGGEEHALPAAEQCSHTSGLTDFGGKWVQSVMEGAVLQGDFSSGLAEGAGKKRPGARPAGRAAGKEEQREQKRSSDQVQVQQTYWEH